MINIVKTLLIAAIGVNVGSVAHVRTDTLHRCSEHLRKNERILTSVDLDAGARNAFEHTVGRGAEPGCLALDFRGSGQSDFAMIGIADESVSAVLRIFFVLNGRPKIQTEFAIGDLSEITFLSREKGNVVRESESFGVRSDSTLSGEPAGDQLRVTYYEKGEVVFFLDKKTRVLRSIQTSD